MEESATVQNTFQVSLITPRGMLFNGKVTSVRLSTVEGIMELLPRHEAVIAPMGYAPLEISLENSDEPEIYAVLGGFLEHDGEKVVILADAAEKSTDIDYFRAEESRKRAQSRLDDVHNNASSNIDEDRARLALIRSLVRLQASGRRGHKE